MEKAIVKYNTPQGEVKLSPQIIRRYLVHGQGNVTDQEVMMFLALCKYQRLNPFLREAYLIKYGKDPATIVVGKEAFLKKARRAKDYAGHKAWVEGDPPDMVGKAEVYVKGFECPICVEVHYEEYVQRKKDGSINRMWKEKPRTMLRKVALVQALREAFPEELGGMYSEEEMPIPEDLPQAPIDQEIIEAEVEQNGEAQEKQNGNGNEAPITQAQRKKLFAMMSDRGLSKEEAKEFYHWFGATSKEQASDLIEHFDDYLALWQKDQEEEKQQQEEEVSRD